MIYLFIAHFLADFLLQSREMGQKKSKSLSYLINHLLIIYVVFGIVSMVVYKSPIDGLMVSTLNTIIHGIIDWYIWKAYALTVFCRRHELKALFSPEVKENQGFMYWNDKMFYTTIGLDQFLHYGTILLLTTIFPL